MEQEKENLGSVLTLPVAKVVAKKGEVMKVGRSHLEMATYIWRPPWQKNEVRLVRFHHKISMADAECVSRSKVGDTFIWPPPW